MKFRCVFAIAALPFVSASGYGGYGVYKRGRKIVRKLSGGGYGHDDSGRPAQREGGSEISIMRHPQKEQLPLKR